MATTANDDDLEEGEIVSDDECKTNENKNANDNANKNDASQSVSSNQETKVKKKKERKHGDKKDKKKSKEHHHHKNDKDLKPTGIFQVQPVTDPNEDDFAGNIEKAIKRVLKKSTDDSKSPKKDDKNDKNAEEESRRKHRKRRRHDESDNKESKKSRNRDDKNLSKEDVDESEMMCVRGASPANLSDVIYRDIIPYEKEQNSDDESHDSDRNDRRDYNNDRRRGKAMGMSNRDRWHDRNRQKFDRRRNDPPPIQEPEEICLFYMQGKCYKGDECVYSHNIQPPRKMELCKFYLMDCCAKREKCLYLHSDFPCKYYHTGLPCVYKNDCKFSHGGPLSENLKLILLKHLESAPKEILGDFPKWPRQKAINMISKTQMRLMQQYSVDQGNNDKFPNSSFDYQDDNDAYDQQLLSYERNKFERNKFPKQRQSRWSDDQPNSSNMLQQSVLSIHSLNGVLSPFQITKLEQIGVENINQLNELTVSQLNLLGITIGQINDIQLNTMNIDKLGMVDNNPTPLDVNPFTRNLKMNQDLDMRISPIVPEAPKAIQNDTFGKDVDMRFEPSSLDTNLNSMKETNKKSLDVDQYTKDAMKYSQERQETNKIEDIPNKEKDVDHRVLNYVRDAAVANVSVVNKDDDVGEVIKECDIDIRFPLPGTQDAPQKIDPEHLRRLTTDDEEDGFLEIDEKWYLSDEEPTEKPSVSDIESSENKKVSEENDPGAIIIANLGEVAKIDISEEVTKLMTTIKNSVSTPADPVVDPVKKDFKSRDPRNMAKKSPERRDSTGDAPKKESSLRREFVSIYDCVEGGTTERRRTDVDLRPSKDLDYRLPQFGDTDLRQTPGGLDVDLRLAFKPLSTTIEIDGSINSHPPMTYKVYAIDIPKPDYTDIKNSTEKSQAISDPRLRRLFRLSLDDNSNDPEKSKSVSADPRKRTKDSSIEKPKNTALDLQTVTHNSNWYKDLSSNQKILVNQQLATVASDLKKFHQDTAPNKVFDLTTIHSNNILLGIFSNLGILLNDKGEVVQTQDKNPSFLLGGYNADAFSNMNLPLPMDNSVNNMMSMSQMNSINQMPQMSNFDPRFIQNDPRAGPPMMGMSQSNLPQNFDGQNYGNFNMSDNFNYNDQYDNTNQYDNANYDDNYDDNFYSNQNKEFHKKPFRRGGERRGRGSRGGRDRRGFTERGNNWQNDRR